MVCLWCNYSGDERDSCALFARAKIILCEVFIIILRPFFFLFLNGRYILENVSVENASAVTVIQLPVYIMLKHLYSVKSFLK